MMQILQNEKIISSALKAIPKYEEGWLYLFIHIYPRGLTYGCLIYHIFKSQLLIVSIQLNQLTFESVNTLTSTR
ncbi:hypothetical protein T10_12752 [Trichinella papuae]|uniref:Uncharacterized protein n=1 Tax=Trichinella papuae TaxID=268474 RepID=A0A0V1MMY5_9BILA|nr:hypothetical protein T10_12752 [Trichinella papuae]